MTSRRGTIAAILAVLAVLVGGGTLMLTADDGTSPPQTVTVEVDTLDGSPDKDKTITVPKVAVDQAEDALTGESAKTIPEVDVASADHTGAADETPAGVPDTVLEANATALAENRATTDALPTAGASGGFAGCRTQFVRNQSSRRGVRPTVQVLHYTVSPNRAGWSDVNAITAFFNRSSSQASSHFIIDAEGNCAYIVPIEAKAWTQAGGNPWAVSYEIIATGREPAYLGSKGYMKLRSVMREVARRTSIPIRAGRISGCSPSRSGIVQHAHGGTCWGGHHDIGPFSFTKVLSKVGTGGCDLACDRRKRHVSAHRELKARNCAPPARTRSERCRFLHRRLAALHKVGVRF